LVTRDQLERAKSALIESEKQLTFPADQPFDERLASKLIELGHLNLWQVTQLLEGRTKFKLGPYRILDSLGQGGMGQVFKAQHEVLGRVVAVKVLPRSKSTPEAVNNFAREMRAQAQLDHPNLVRAYDAGEDGNVRYLVTEYVPGKDLRKWVRANGPMDMADAASVITQIAAALHHAHTRGLVHRDVKPGNVLVTPEGVAKLLDLGLAGPLQGGLETDPRFGRIVGTADYLSPDHVQNPCNPTPAWDIYSLGCTLYYAATGKVPFPGGTTADKIQAHLKLRPLDPRRLNPALSNPFIEVLAEMMAKDPRERTPSAAEVIARLLPWANAAEPASIGNRLPMHEPHRALPPRIEASSSSRTYSSRYEALSGYEDTQTSLPELPPAPRENSGQLSQPTHPIASAADETCSSLDVTNDQPVPATDYIAPLLVLVLFPLGVVALVFLIWWLSTLFG
jgi:serine/threonine protein kinase